MKLIAWPQPETRPCSWCREKLACWPEDATDDLPLPTEVRIDGDALSLCPGCVEDHEVAVDRLLRKEEHGSWRQR